MNMARYLSGPQGSHLCQERCCLISLLVCLASSSENSLTCFSCSRKAPPFQCFLLLSTGVEQLVSLSIPGEGDGSQRLKTFLTVTVGGGTQQYIVA